MRQTTKVTKEERKKLEDIFAKKYERLQKVSYHSAKLIEDTKNAKIRKLTEKFEAETAAIIKKYKKDTQEQHSIRSKELDRLYAKYMPQKWYDKDNTKSY